MTSENDSQYGADDTIGAYVILDRIHGGGMGQVYRARPKTGGGLVAIKVCVESAYYARFRREVELMQRLPDHKNLMRILDANLDVTPPYFVMPLAVKSVRDEMGEESRDFLSQERAVDVVIEVCEALATIHGNRLIHRDVKPDNILIMNDSSVVLADFGLCKELDVVGSQVLTKTGSAPGTPRYRSPEQVNSPADIDCRTDVYSLGLTLQELLSGDIGDLDDSGDIDGAIVGVIEKATQQRRDERYPSIEAMGKALSMARDLIDSNVDVEDLKNRITVLADRFGMIDAAVQIDESTCHEFECVFKDLRRMVRAGDVNVVDVFMKVEFAPWVWNGLSGWSGVMESFQILMREAGERLVMLSRSGKLKPGRWVDADKLWNCYGFLVEDEKSIDDDLFVSAYYFLFVISTHYYQFTAMNRAVDVLKACRVKNKLSRKLAKAIEKDKGLGMRFFGYMQDDAEINTAIRLVKKQWSEERK